MTPNLSSAVMQQRHQPHKSLDDFPNPFDEVQNRTPDLCGGKVKYSGYRAHCVRKTMRRYGENTTVYRCKDCGRWHVAGVRNGDRRESRPPRPAPIITLTDECIAVITALTEISQKEVLMRPTPKIHISDVLAAIGLFAAVYAVLSMPGF